MFIFVASVLSSVSQFSTRSSDDEGLQKALFDDIPAPRELVSHLDQYVIGQTAAKTRSVSRRSQPLQTVER